MSEPKNEQQSDRDNPAELAPDHAYPASDASDTALPPTETAPLTELQPEHLTPAPPSGTTHTPPPLQDNSEDTSVPPPQDDTTIRQRSEFKAVDDAAKELARAALQAEIEREEKKALEGYEAEEGEIPPSPEVARRFDVILQIGKGGMAVVYLCRDPRNQGRIVAVKDIRAEFKPGMRVEERVEHEVNLLMSLNHEGIVKVFDFMKFPRGSAIVMEYIDGLPLDHEIGGGRRISPEFGVRVLHEIGKALEYAHARGVIHRDIKPDNILYSERQRVMKLVDFGLARLYGEDKHASMTRTGMVVGTPHYMSPEQVSGKALDQRSDIYSLGATLYYLLTGKRHVEGSNIMDILEQQRSRPILPPSHIRSDIPAWLSYVVGRMMEIRPEDRYGSIREVLNDLATASQSPSQFLQAANQRLVKRYGGKPLALSGQYSTGVAESDDPASMENPARYSDSAPVIQASNYALPAEDLDEIKNLIVGMSARLDRAEENSIAPKTLYIMVLLAVLVAVVATIVTVTALAKSGQI